MMAHETARMVTVLLIAMAALHIAATKLRTVPKNVMVIVSRALTGMERCPPVHRTPKVIQQRERAIVLPAVLGIRLGAIACQPALAAMALRMLMSNAMTVRPIPILDAAPRIAN